MRIPAVTERKQTFSVPTDLRGLVAGGIASSALLVTSCRDDVRSSPESEALSTLQSIHGALEAYRAETGSYAGCTEQGLNVGRGAIRDADFFPRHKDQLDKSRVEVNDAATPLARCFQTIGVQFLGRPRFTFAIRGDRDSFEVVGFGDPDGDGTLTEVRLSSDSEGAYVDGRKW